MDKPSQIKSFLKVKVTYYNSEPLVYAMFDNNSKWHLLTTKTNDVDDNNVTFIIDRELRKAKSIKIRLESAARPIQSGVNSDGTSHFIGLHDTEVDSVGIVFRAIEMPK